MKLLALAPLAVILILAGCEKTEHRQFSQQALDKALADPGRKDQQRADAVRKPGPLIALAGVKTGDKVLDLIPGSGYWTRIFSKIVGPDGKVYAVWPQAYARDAMGNVADLRKLSADKYYGNIVTEVQPTTKLSAPEKLDVVWTSQNFHDYPDEFMRCPREIGREPRHKARRYSRQGQRLFGAEHALQRFAHRAIRM